MGMIHTAMHESGRPISALAPGLPGGTSFMEDNTCGFRRPAEVLGARMLEVCPLVAESRPSLEIHSHAIGDEEDPVRLVFTARSGAAIVASKIDLENRFRMVANEVDVIPPDEPMPELPVARAVWVPSPSLKAASTALLYTGGSRHASLSQAMTICNWQILLK